MSATATTKRPWVAAVLSVLFPGLGHVYLREWLRTAMWLVLMVAVASLLIPPESVPQEVTLSAMLEASRTLPLDVSVAILGLRALNVLDAYVLARQATQREAVVSGHNCPNCGHELDDPDLSFCPWCATELDATPGERPDATATAEDNSRFGP
ncbi:MAG: zinc ribbon domain-containing protein [Halorhabdus sp.]